MNNDVIKYGQQTWNPGGKSWSVPDKTRSRGRIRQLEGWELRLRRGRNGRNWDAGLQKFLEML